MKYGLLFGINYSRTPEARLRGCVNDVNNMGNFLKESLKFDKVKIYTDDNNIYDTGFQNIIYSLYRLAMKTLTKDIDIVYIHFSGHGTSMIDRNNDESDGKDEAFVPSDYKNRGVITDDLFKKVFKLFNKKTKVVCVFDCCHSGTIGDLKYKCTDMDDKTIHVVNNEQKCKAKIMTISGCRDDQTSADAFNVMNQRKFTGALTSCLLMILQQSNENSNIFEILKRTRELLKEKGFSQYPQLCSSWKMLENEPLLD